jgi:DNA mismatch repair protein MutS2
LAYTDKRFQNASVQFSIDTLKPTYKLIIGIPGKSNAITIAQNLGLNENIVNYANEIYLTQKDKSNIVLEGLQEAQRELDKNIDIAKEKRQEIENLEQDYKEKIEKARVQRKKTVDIYKKKYDTQLSQVKDEIKKILEEIRRTKSEKVARRAFFRLSEIENNAADDFRNDLDEIAPEYQKVDWEKVKIGDTLFLRSLNQLVTLAEVPLKKKYVIVKVGAVPMQVKKEDLFLTEKVLKQENNFKNKKGFEFSKKRVETTLDIRGERVLEGLDILDKYLDEANLSNIPQVTIIHGAGTGALRKAVREYLKDSPYVKSFRSGKEFEGADGVSIVELK